MRQAALALTALVAISLPVAIGVLRAQTLPPPPEYTYEVVSIRPAASNEPFRSLIGPGPQGGMRGQNVAVVQMLRFAYEVSDSMLADVPDWAKTERYDVTFTPDREELTLGPGLPDDQRDGLLSRQRQRWQAVLRDRFGLVLRVESREMPLYALTIAKGGSKLTPAANDGPGRKMMMSPGRITAQDADMRLLTSLLSNQLGRPVVDETGLEGKYDFVVDFTPDGSIVGPAGSPRPAAPGQPPSRGDASGPSIFTALTEQLGLKLESRKGIASVLVVEKIEKPEAN
jgi:uncharacterized protein (TIGR03435 family)